MKNIFGLHTLARKTSRYIIKLMVMLGDGQVGGGGLRWRVGCRRGAGGGRGQCRCRDKCEHKCYPWNITSGGSFSSTHLRQASVLS